MIEVDGYFYDVDAETILDHKKVTIASTSILNPADENITGIVVQEGSTTDDYAAVTHISTSNPGIINPSYSVIIEILGIPLPVIGTINSSNFVYDENNILVWFKLYYDAIKRRTDAAGEAPHTIRFCRNTNPDIYYIEYNPDLYSDYIILCTDSRIAINDIFTNGDMNVYLYVYSNNVSGIIGYNSYYIGAVSFDANGAVNKLSKSSEIDRPNVTVENQAALITTADELIAKIVSNRGTMEWHKSNNSYALAIINNYADSAFGYGYGPVVFWPDIDGWNGYFYPNMVAPTGAAFTYGGILWYRAGANPTLFPTVVPEIITNVPELPWVEYYKLYGEGANEVVLEQLGVTVTIIPGSDTKQDLYEYLIFTEEPESEVTPTDIPPVDEPTDPAQPDIQDPYYDPTSDPKSTQYDPTKDPKSPSYDPSVPHTPYRPVSQPEYHKPPVQPPQDDISLPPTPPSYITNNKMFTLYNPSGGDLNNVATFLWSSGWSVDAFKKIFANPIQCILGLMVLPQLSATVSTKELTFGNIPSGINLHYFDSQFFDFDCGSFTIKEYYASYLDYAPYTKVSIFLPFIGDHELNTDEVMNKTITVKYRFDLATGDCVAFIFVDSSIYYQFSGNCAARLPIGGSSSNALSSLFSLFSMAASVPAGLPALGAASAIAVTSMKQKISHSGSISGSAGLMGVLTPYLIVTRPRQAYPMNQNIFTGYPSFVTESLSQLTGYTEVEQVHLEHIPATGEELVELERLLKEGVLF